MGYFITLLIVTVLTIATAYCYRTYLIYRERFERLRNDTRERIAISEMEKARSIADAARYEMMQNQPKPFFTRHPVGKLTGPR